MLIWMWCNTSYMFIIFGPIAEHETSTIRLWLILAELKSDMNTSDLCPRWFMHVSVSPHIMRFLLYSMLNVCILHPYIFLLCCSWSFPHYSKKHTRSTYIKQPPHSPEGRKPQNISTGFSLRKQRRRQICSHTVSTFLQHPWEVFRRRCSGPQRCSKSNPS